LPALAWTGLVKGATPEGFLDAAADLSDVYSETSKSSLFLIAEADDLAGPAQLVNQTSLDRRFGNSDGRQYSDRPCVLLTKQSEKQMLSVPSQE
jgi:hypothetical protein